MKKQNYIILIILIVAAGAGFYFFWDKTPDQLPQSEPISEAPQSVPAAPQNDLPYMTLTKLDGSQLMTREIAEKAILLVFLPDCDHCQREAVQIRENKEAFKAYTFYFISSAPLAEISQFAKTYQLEGNENFIFAHTPFQNIMKSFGPVPTPSLYIYEKGGRKVKEFIGETPIEQILSAI